jgi:hypothetical protein
MAWRNYASGRKVSLARTTFWLTVVCQRCGRDVRMHSDQRVSTCPHCHSAL